MDLGTTSSVHAYFYHLITDITFSKEGLWPYGPQLFHHKMLCVHLLGFVTHDHNQQCGWPQKPLHPSSPNVSTRPSRKRWSHELALFEHSMGVTLASLVFWLLSFPPVFWLRNASIKPYCTLKWKIMSNKIQTCICMKLKLDTKPKPK